MTTLADMRAALRGFEFADEAIFWYCYSWHTGRDSDFYRIMCESPFQPDDSRQFRDDPRVTDLFLTLQVRFPPMSQKPPPYQPVKLDDVRAGDILIAGSAHLSLKNRWPCRVFEYGGQLAVVDKLGAVILTTDDRGYVVGFRR